MKGFIATLIATGVALWVAARFVPGIEIPSAAFATIPEDLIAFGIVAVVFGVANGLIGPIVKTLALPFNLVHDGPRRLRREHGPLPRRGLRLERDRRLASRSATSRRTS